MTERQKATFIIETLGRLFPEPAITLERRDAFTFLVAVVLSAQSTDKRVNEVTPALFAIGGTPGAMMNLSVEQIRAIIRPVGLSNTKAANLQKLSQIIVEKHEGIVPASFEELEALPGVGHKTASVIMSQAFGVPAFPVDTHIHRLMTRWGMTSGKNVVQTEKDAKRLFPEQLWTKLHLQLIYYGREYSPAGKKILEKDIITRTLLTDK